MDHKEQQDQELEALESIFPDEYKLIQKDPIGICEFDLKTKDYNYNQDEAARVIIRFTYTPKYPDEIPTCSVEEIQNAGETDDIIEFINTHASENLGMPMIYTIVFALLEKIELFNETRKVSEAENKARLERERELEELRRFEGTKVNVESFLKWKAKFDQEMFELKRKTADTGPKKPTGKQLFEKNEALDESDLQFENEEAIEVDESLFQSMDGLDIDNSEDYRPDDDDIDEDDEEEEEEEEEE